LAANPADWIPLFFEYPATLTVIALNVAGFGLSLAAVRQFSRGEPLRLAWSLIALAAAANLASGVLSQVSGDGWLRARLILGGPMQTVLLLAGLAPALGVYRRAGILGRLRGRDRVTIAIAAAFSVWEICDLVFQTSGFRAGFQQAVNLSNDPLLTLLLIEATLIRRSALKMGRGLIARCWGAFSAAILLTFLGDVGVWLAAHGPVPVPLAGTAWYLWFLASGAYALAPAYQLEACRRAGTN
jgi:hypothetical protein